MKINELERSDPIYEGKNVHELINEISEELDQLEPKLKTVNFVKEKTKLKIGVLY